ncbi:UNVERIFIED_CONTAM: hypothetical protein GTU68_024635 [Idotea baltica]|nr:hypothetical protein [Idotea baltica]
MRLSRMLWRSLLSAVLRSAKWLSGWGSTPSRFTLGRRNSRSRRVCDLRLQNKLLR